MRVLFVESLCDFVVERLHDFFSWRGCVMFCWEVVWFCVCGGCVIFVWRGCVIVITRSLMLHDLFFWRLHDFFCREVAWFFLLRHGMIFSLKRFHDFFVSRGCMIFCAKRFLVKKSFLVKSVFLLKKLFLVKKKEFFVVETRRGRHVTRDMWHMTPDTWQVTRDMFGGGVDILSKFQLPSSYRLWFMILWRSGGKGLRT